MTIVQVIALSIFLYWFAMFIVHVRGLRLVPELPVVKLPLDEEPLVSVIIAAKDEGAAIGKTIASLTKQSYQNLEILIVNDRSTDATGAIAESWKQEDFPKVKVIHIEALPEGWLGKNYAMYTGFQHAEGSLLLFTDADIEFRPDTIRSAVGYMQKHQVDHLSLIPYFITRSFWLRGFVHFFAATLYLSKQPWKPNDDRRTKDGIGIGAFMLLTRDAYEQIGTHHELKFRPDDDLQLGIRVKQKGLKQRYMIGADHIRVEWYPSLSAAAQGLEKNIYAGINYSLPTLFFVIIAVLLFHVFPFIGIWVLGGWVRPALALAVLFMLGVYFLYGVKVSRDKPYDLVVLPLTALVYLYVFVRSCIITLRRGGIYWRGTFYTLADLKRRIQ